MISNTFGAEACLYQAVEPFYRACGFMGFPAATVQRIRANPVPRCDEAACTGLLA